MKVELWAVGSTSFDYIEKGSRIYEKRLKRFLPFKQVILPDLKNTKNMPLDTIKQKEGEAILQKIEASDWLILFDEKGKAFTSTKFAKWMEKRLQHSSKRIIFLIGGAYGFSETIYQRANEKIALSKMTFSHQMVRLFAIEQIYRAMTILKNMPYHHE